jgi:tetratricopeptide (TPR) repeat protein
MDRLLCQRCYFSDGIVRLILAVFVVWTCAVTGAFASNRDDTLTRKQRVVLQKAQQAISDQRYSAAADLLKDHVVSQDAQSHYLVYFTLGNALMLNRNAADALPHYQRAANINPDDAAVWQNMGKAYYEMQRYADAGNCFSRALGLASSASNEAIYQTAAAFLFAGQPADALPLLQDLATRDTAQHHPEWGEALLKAYLDLERGDKALEHVRGLLQTFGERPALWKTLAKLHIDGGDYVKAAAAMEIYSTLASPDAQETRLLGSLYRMADVPLKAAKTYAALLDGDPRAADFEQSAAAYIAARRLDRAKDVLLRGIAHRSTPDMWRMLAGVYYQREAFEKAYDAYDHLLQRDPSDGAAHLMKGYCAMQLNRLEASKTAFTRAARFSRYRDEATEMLNHIETQDALYQKEVISDAVQ